MHVVWGIRCRGVTMTLVEIINSPELSDIVSSAPITAQDSIALRLLSEARRLTGTINADAFETQARIESADLRTVRSALTDIARKLAEQAHTELRRCKPAKASVKSIQAAWGIEVTETPATKKSVRLDLPEGLDKIALLKFIQDALHGETPTQRRIYSQVLREASNAWPVMSEPT